LNRLLLCLSLVAAVLSLPPGIEGDARMMLLPRLKAGQTLHYEIRGKLQRHLKTESRVSTMLHTPDLHQDFTIKLLLSVREVRKANGRLMVAARVDLQSEGENASSDVATATPKVEFTINGDGQLANVEGLDNLDSEQLLAWQFWIARFAYGWTLPESGVRPGSKWKSDEIEKTPSPIANLVWERENTYAEDNRCPVIRGETCAGFLTHATLKQKSSPKDATPEDYRLHELKTTGAAEGTNETFTYVSLKTGLVLRATEEVKQSMEVTILKADATNGVHYDVEASSHLELLFIPATAGGSR